MGLKDILEKMKLVEVEEAAKPPAPAAASAGAASAPGGAGTARAPAGRPAPAASIDEILRSLPSPPKMDEKTAAALTDRPGAAAAGSGASAGAGGSAAAGLPEFPSIYKAAGVIDPPHGYGVYKVMEIFASEGFTGLDTRAKAAALQGFLKMNPTGPVPMKDIIQDAIRRDQALDSYEEFYRKKVEGRATATERENADLQAEIDAVLRKNRDKMDANRAAIEEERRRLSDWQAMKRVEERKLYDAVAPFVEPNPITLGPAGGAADAVPAGKPKA